MAAKLVSITTADVLGTDTSGSVTFTPSTRLAVLSGTYTVLEPVTVALGTTASIFASDNLAVGVLTWDVVATLGVADNPSQPLVTLSAPAVAINFANGATQDLSTLGLR